MFTMLNVVYDHFLTRKTQFFTLFMLSRTSDNTTSQNIGGPMHGRSPHLSFFGGASPQSPTRSPPLLIGYDRHNHTDATFTESSDFNDFSGDPHRCHSREQRSTPSLNLRGPFNDDASMSKADISHRFQSHLRPM